MFFNHQAGGALPAFKSLARTGAGIRAALVDIDFLTCGGANVTGRLSRGGGSFKDWLTESELKTLHLDRQALLHDFIYPLELIERDFY